MTIDALDPKSTQRNPAKLAPYSSLAEPMLAFDSQNPRALDVHPLRGLAKFGPFSRTTIGAFNSTVRVATVGPRSGTAQVRKLFDGLHEAKRAEDRSGYVPDFPGYEAVLHGQVRLADNPSTHITWPEHIQDLGGDGSPQEVLAAAIERAISTLSAIRSEFDVVAVHLPDAWSDVCRSVDFDAHHFLKATSAVQAIPTQVLNDRVFTFRYEAQRSWRLSIALYVKVGGIPWKLAPLPGVPTDTAYIGLAYAFRGDPREARFVTCCSQVFDPDGGGMQFVAYDASDPVQPGDGERNNPYLGRSDMRAVMARSLRTYQARNGGLVPRRVVIHKLTTFRDEELDGISDALSSIDEVECLEITENVPWRAVWMAAPRGGQKSRPDGYPVHRGTMLPMSGTSALVWAAGNTLGVSSKGSFYQGQKSIPRPLILRRHMGRGSLETAALEALALTKMDWNNDALYDPLPVTIQYSRRLAHTIAAVPSLRNAEYPYRMFM